MWVELAKRSKG